MVKVENINSVKIDNRINLGTLCIKKRLRQPTVTSPNNPLREALNRIFKAKSEATAIKQYLTAVEFETSARHKAKGITDVKIKTRSLGFSYQPNPKGRNPD